MIKETATNIRQKHWDNVFNNNDYNQVLWHQSSPQKSLKFINKYANNDAYIIDAGCGASYLVDNLLQDGYKNITLLDTSNISLKVVKKRLNNNTIKYRCEDILNFKANQKFDIWHDRAVFHFLLSKKERKKYFEVLSESLKDGGICIISTFAMNGPTKCAGLDIVQYDKNKMITELPNNLELIEDEEFTHITPKNTEQKYIYFIIKRAS